MDKIYVVTKNATVLPNAFTSLKALCDQYGLNYSSVSKGKRLLFKRNDFYVICPISIVRIKGREGNFKGKTLKN